MGHPHFFDYIFNLWVGWIYYSAQGLQYNGTKNIYFLRFTNGFKYYLIVGYGGILCLFIFTIYTFMMRKNFLVFPPHLLFHLFYYFKHDYTTSQAKHEPCYIENMEETFEKIYFNKYKYKCISILEKKGLNVIYEPIQINNPNCSKCPLHLGWSLLFVSLLV